jgi:hypothetical protein
MCCADEKKAQPAAATVPYVVGWSFWFDDGSLTPQRFTHQQDENTYPEKGHLSGIVHFSDGTRRSVQGSEIYGIWRGHPSGEPVFLQYGSGQMAPHEVERALVSIREWYPGAVLWLGRNAPDILQKRANDAAAEEKLR